MKINEVILSVLKDIYSKDHELIVKKKQIDLIEKEFKNARKNNIKSYDDIIENIKSEDIIDFSENIACEVNKQLKMGKALQPGILFECSVAKTISKIYNLNNFFNYDDLVEAGINDKYEVEKICPDMPSEFYNYFDKHVRYMYYDKNSKDVFIAQYGDPSKIDLEMYYHGEIVKIEIKDFPAKAGEYDVKYDDDGKIIPSDKMLGTNYEDIIENFNNNESVFDNLGNNIPITDAKSKTKILNKYIFDKEIDIIVTSYEDYLTAIYKNDLFFFTTAGSEIRTTGKNWGNPFISNKKIISFIKTINGTEIREDKIKIPEYALSDQKKKGHINEMSAKKINQILKIQNGDYCVDNGYVCFSIKDLKQVKATISIHISIDRSMKYDDFKSHYLKITIQHILSKPINYIDGEGKKGLIVYRLSHDKNETIHMR